MRMWISLGKYTENDPTDPLGCCGKGNIPGVTCIKDKVIALNWNNQNLKGSFPSDSYEHLDVLSNL
jgi:hypothetical protein